MHVAIGVFAASPLPGHCLPKLATTYTPEWSAGFYAAMLRDTLDGLQSIDASEYVVLAKDEEARAALQRHVHPPWRIAEAADAATALAVLEPGVRFVMLARSDAPSALTDGLGDLFRADRKDLVVLGPSVGDGAPWLVGATTESSLLRDLRWGADDLATTMRARCTNDATTVLLHELPAAIIIDEPDSVSALLDELRRHPERAPRTAQYVVTHA